MREVARSLRIEGLSRRQIAERIGLRPDNSSIQRWIADLPRPEWTRRARAKDELRSRALSLRRMGASYSEIATATGVAKGTLSSWLRDIELSSEQRDSIEARRVRAGRRDGARSTQARAQVRRAQTLLEARGQIGQLDARDLFIAGVVAYWAEGTKLKPWGRGPRVTFINSDPSMILVFRDWLDLVGVDRGSLTYRISIHRSADEALARVRWAEILEINPRSLARSTIKRGSAETRRRNTGDDYIGCLTIDVRRSADLYYRIEGWYKGIVRSLGCGVTGVHAGL